MLGVKASRLYVELDAFPIDLKVYSRDLQEHHGVRFEIRGDTALAGKGGGPVFRLGDGVLVKTAGHDRKRGRWQLVARPEPA